MRLVILTVLATLTLVMGSACTKHAGLTPAQNIACNAETAVSKATSLVIAGTLNCTNSAQIQADLMTVLGNVNMCRSTSAAMAKLQLKRGDVKAKGVLGNIVCPLAVNAVVGFMSAEIPAKWSCTPKSSVAVETVSAIATTACEGAIVF